MYQIEFDDTWENDDINEQDIDVLVTFHKFQENYGADADGNRGMMMWFVEDLDVSIFDSEGDDITSLVQARDPLFYNRLLDKANALADEYEVEREYEPEDDYDADADF